MHIFFTNVANPLFFQADDSVDEEVLNHYCWMYSTFDIPEDFMVSAGEYLCIPSAQASVKYATKQNPNAVKYSS